MNELMIMLFAPLVAGFIAWALDIRGIREIVGILGAAVPLGILAKYYSTIAGSNPETVTHTITIGGFKLLFQLNTITWYFAAVASLVGVAMAFGMASTSRSSYEWLFALMSYTGVLGVFLSQDFVGFFLFWELMTFASFMMVLKRNRHESLKYFVLSVIGAYAMLIAIGILYAKTGALDFGAIRQALYMDAMLGSMSKGLTALVFLLFLTAFGVKAGAVPLHVWAPGAYSKVDQSYTTFFSGALSKAGAYGFLLIYILMGAKLYYALGVWHGHLVFGYIIAWLGAITVVVAGFLAVLQEDIRKLFAYSSISQVGYILLGLGIGTSLGFVGALFHVLSHAVFKGLFWLVVAALILRTGKTKFEDFGGLAEKMPITFAMALIAVLSLAGIPPMAGFASKWLLYEAAISAHMPLVAGAIFLGSGLAFAYVVRFLYAVWFGQRPSDLEDVKEAPLPLLIGMAILAIPNLVFGIAPGLVVKFIDDIMYSLFQIHIPVGGDYFKLVTPTGTYNALLVTVILTLGLAIAGLIFIYGAKARKVPVTDTYQSGNPVTEDYNLSMRRNFYRPLAEALDFWLKYSWDRFYERLAGMFEDFADSLREGFYNGNVQSYAWYLAVVLLILALWGVL
ncbi:proton-conducting transporter transmembrane domain-containing protein [Thermococcus nautili]|uniref:Formate hydrogenlyase subunit 3/Multisubunit Na+/H+ antiporter, MnhD subunit n=1 Tax=Thermococcus nautili TaxID=195522 RepID=W8PIS5_9EURY|nr:proton-conducting transporter membrane subunit [Thermococcus nautili]AHL22019.1 Formate hydrogenlyase subunit 3/Multisubunit Na+/H+ antiporter, MnhD subunit [Thermococcus nautili]